MKTLFITPSVSHVTCHLSHFTRHISHVKCYMCFFYFFWGGGGGRAKTGASSGWRVRYPLGTPRLVLIRTTIVVYCNFIDSVENLKSATYFKFSKISNFYIFEIRTFKIHTFTITPKFRASLHGSWNFAKFRGDQSKKPPCNTSAEFQTFGAYNKSRSCQAYTILFSIIKKKSMRMFFFPFLCISH